MKLRKTLLLFLGIATFCSVQAQQKKEANLDSSAFNAFHGAESLLYGLQTQSGQPYTPIDSIGAVDINNGQIWDDPDIRVALPFPFHLLGIAIDSLDFNSGFGGVLGALNNNNPMRGLLLSPIQSDLIDRGFLFGMSRSSIKYRVDGTTPNRIMKFQWENCGSFDEAAQNTTLAEFVNIQMWLYEGSNIIDFRHGPQSATLTPAFWHWNWPGLLSGIYPADWFNGDPGFFHLLMGSPTNPQLTNIRSSMTGMPENGMVYRLIPAEISVEEKHPDAHSTIFPNPVVDVFQVNAAFADGTYQVIDLQGRKVAEGQLEGPKGDLQGLAGGQYFIHIAAKNKRHLQRLIKL
jgi:hypothetical protein